MINLFTLSKLQQKDYQIYLLNQWETKLSFKDEVLGYSYSSHTHYSIQFKQKYFETLYKNDSDSNMIEIKIGEF